MTDTFFANTLYGVPEWSILSTLVLSREYFLILHTKESPLYLQEHLTFIHHPQYKEQNQVIGKSKPYRIIAP